MPRQPLKYKDYHAAHTILKHRNGIDAQELGLNRESHEYGAGFEFGANSSERFGPFANTLPQNFSGMEVAVRLYQPLKPVIATHSFLVGSYQGGESETLGSVPITRGAGWCCRDVSVGRVHVAACAPAGKTTIADLRKLIEETRRGTTNYRSRMFGDMMFYFNDAPNLHGRPEARRRKYCFGIVPKRPKGYDDTKVPDAPPVLIPVDGEAELLCDQLLTRYREHVTVLIIQGVLLRCDALCCVVLYRACG